MNDQLGDRLRLLVVWLVNKGTLKPQEADEIWGSSEWAWPNPHEYPSVPNCDCAERTVVLIDYGEDGHGILCGTCRKPYLVGIAPRRGS
jgi:hypothetical protein